MGGFWSRGLVACDVGGVVKTWFVLILLRGPGIGSGEVVMMCVRRWWKPLVTLWSCLLACMGRILEELSRKAGDGRGRLNVFV